MNWVGNMSVSRAGNRFGTMYIQNPGGRTSAYFADNRSNLWPARSDWDLNYCCNDYNGQAGTRPSWALSARHPFPAVTTMAASQVRDYAVANHGAFPRDPMDRRLMGFVAQNTIDTRAANTNPANDAHALSFSISVPPAYPADTDNDGMPDSFETSNGLNPNVQDHNGTQLSLARTGVNGYTNLEVYLNELSNSMVRTGR